MPLFTAIQNDPRLSQHQDFVYFLLCRLSISDIMAAVKFPKKTCYDTSENDSTVIKNIKVRCDERQYSLEHKESVILIFQDIWRMAQLIQAAWLEQALQDQKDVAGVREEAMALAQLMKPDVTSTNLLDATREYAKEMTEQILNSLEQPLSLELFPCIMDILCANYPKINQDLLVSAIENMESCVRQLNESRDTIMVDRKISNHSIFSTHPRPSETVPHFMGCILS